LSIGGFDDIAAIKNLVVFTVIADGTAASMSEKVSTNNRIRSGHEILNIHLSREFVK